MINEAGLNHEMIEELRELGGDELVAEIVAAYLQEGRGDVASLREAAVTGDARAPEQVGHRFKSASASIGAATISGYAEELHYLGRAGSTEGATDLVRAFDAAWELAEAELTALQHAA